MKSVSHYCKDKWVILYVERWLKSGIIKQDGCYIESLTGTPQGGVMSPLLASIFMHVCFDNWMKINHPEKPFERYADDIVVHCKTEKQALYILKCIALRLQNCKLSLHPNKTKIINLRGFSEKKYPKSFDFLGFTIHANWVKEKMVHMPSIFISNKSKSSVLQKFKELNIHKRRKSIELIAKELKPIIDGVINYYCKFSIGKLRYIWYQLNLRLLKWVKWEKGLYKNASLKWLRKKYKEQPTLFPHWNLVHP